MDNSDAKKSIIVNVKGIEPEAWEMARKLASKHDESLGSVVSRALRQLYNIDTGPRETMPSREANLIPEMANPPLTEDQRTARMQAVAALMQGLAAVKQATGRASGRDVVMDAARTLIGAPPNHDPPPNVTRL